MSKNFISFIYKHSFCLIILIFFYFIPLYQYCSTNTFKFGKYSNIFTPDVLKQIKENKNVHLCQFSKENQAIIKQFNIYTNKYSEFDSKIHYYLYKLFKQNVLTVKGDNVFYYTSFLKEIDATYLLKQNNIPNNNSFDPIALCGSKNAHICNTDVKEDYRGIGIGTLTRMAHLINMFKKYNSILSCTTPDSVGWHKKQPGSQVQEDVSSKRGYFYTTTEKQQFYKDIQKQFPHLNIYEGMAQNIMEQKILAQINKNYNKKKQNN
jgi:hypothetical protein